MPEHPLSSFDDPIDWSAVAEEATELLSRYLRIDTTNPPGSELAAAHFLAAALRGRDFAPTLYESAPGRANLLARLPATQRGARKGIILLHHMDVVPADPTRWSCDPFGGEVRDGCVWGRGALDTKSLGVMHLLALDLLRRSGVARNRDLIYLAVADEEVASSFGVRWMLENHRSELDAEIVWDEGGFGLQGFFGENVVFTVAVAEKQSLWLRLVAAGKPGHGSVPHDDNANDRLVRALARISEGRAALRLHPVVRRMFMDVAPTQPFPRSWVFRHLHHPLVRAAARQGLTADPTIAAIVQNTVSITRLHAGSKANVIPERAEAVLDTRLLPGEDPDVFAEGLAALIDDDRVRVEVIKSPSPDSVSDYDSDFFRSMQQVAARLVPGSVTAPVLTPGATDSAHFRRAGLNTFGLLPAVITAKDLTGVHGIDEHIAVDNLGLGTRMIYEVLMAAVSG